ncbi:MAG: helix-turn-helix transcriptional regulator [Bacteroidales bacterium]|nr:helix-turn-helix transcriptional regulator [Bacteroidales bacterium]
MMLNKKMKMSELVEANFHLLGILSRLGIRGSFSDHTVEEICNRYFIDPDTFILICTVYSGREIKPTEEQLRHCKAEDLLLYLHSSHEYYVNSALAKLAPSIEEMIRPTQPVRQKVFRQFFNDYRTELEKHFAYEEQVVIPYVRQLLEDKVPSGYSISRFREAHSNIEESLSDLKNLIMQSMPPECDGEPRIEVLSNIFHLQEDLKHHTYIEDDILVPLVELYEKRVPGFGRPPRTEDLEENRNDLSDREKEVLILVARGLLNKEIADKLHISINTVITHRKNITRKTGIKTAPGLTVYAILNGLVDINSIE